MSVMGFASGKCYLQESGGLFQFVVVPETGSPSAQALLNLLVAEDDLELLTSLQERGDYRYTHHQA